MCLMSSPMMDEIVVHNKASFHLNFLKCLQYSNQRSQAHNFLKIEKVKMSKREFTKVKNYV